MLKTIVTLSNLESFSEALIKSREEVDNMNSGEMKIGRAKLIKSKTSKNSTMSKIAKITLLKTTSKAKLFSVLKSKPAFIQLK